MRRSEALEIIWDAINELEDADHILTKLEEAGMMPPFNSKIHNSNWSNANDGYIWEPENEEK